MDRRELLGVLGAAAGLVAVTGSMAHAQREGHAHRDKVYEDCLRACEACERSCNETFHYSYTQLAEGKSNAAIAESLVLTKRAVEKHINSIFTKLGLAAADDVSKRVKAALLFLAEDG